MMIIRIPRLFLMLASALALLGGCKSKPTSRTRPDAKLAETTVRRFFAALEKKDCAALKRVIGGALARRIEKKGGCPHLFEQDPLAKVRLVSVTRSSRDGREPKAFIVSVVVDKEGKHKKLILRIVRQGRELRLVEI